MKKIIFTNNCKLENTVITLGKFDGNHIGHCLLLDKTISIKEEGQKTVIFTFNISPKKLKSDRTFKTIQTYTERVFKGYENKIDFIVEFPFNNETKHMEADDFIKSILVDRLGVKKIVVGTDFHFGRDRKGDVETLKKAGEKYGFEVFALEKVMYKPSDFDTPQEVSSTLIKNELLKGNIADANNMLGRPFSVSGEVLHGKRLGNTIGFPTVNQEAPADKILPPDGVYATKTVVDGNIYTSITNVGKRPTFDDGEVRTIETFLCDFNGDLYGKVIEVLFYKYIRTERKFNGIDELKNEIASNVIEIKEFFENYNGV